MAKAVTRDADHPSLSPAHPIHMALKWQRMLDVDPNLRMAEIARNQSVSRARITQIMNLLALPKEILESLIALRNPTEIAFLNERRLRAIAACATAEMQMCRFHELQHSFRTNGAN
jgi:hypothetical protein